MLLAGNALYDIIDQNILEGADPSNVNAASIDVRLADTILLETLRRETVDLAAKQTQTFEAVTADQHVIRPGVFFLAHTVERFNLPDDISAQFVLKSSVARVGLNHLLAGWADAGFHDSHLTLEFHNVSSKKILLTAGMKIGQMVFFRHAHVGEQSYRLRGRYNGSNGVVTSKGV